MNQESSVDFIHLHTMRLLVLADVLREKEAGETDVAMLLMRSMRVRLAWMQWALAPECFGGLRR
jgi:hypothetical protein